VTNYLQHVSVLRRRLAAAERQRDRAYAQLMAFLDTVTEDDITRSSAPLPTSSINSIRVSKAWTKILQQLCRYKRFRVSDAVIESQRLSKLDKIARVQTPGSARAQISLLAKKGIVKRLGGGNYELSAQAKVRFDDGGNVEADSKTTAGDAR
jgi:hypothetical protein